MKRLTVVFFSACFSFFIAGQASATIITSADVSGYHTFQDLNTGRIWLDLGSFFNQTPDQMIAAASQAGFSLATKADLSELLNSLPLTNGEWSTYRPIMGGAPNRDLIWAAYEDEIDPVDSLGYGFSYSTDNSWSLYDNIAPRSYAQNGGGPYADMNIWAYQTGEIPENGVVPEPASMVLMGMGLVGAAMRRRKK